MTEWLLSGHNTQESTGVARPVTVTMTEQGLDAQINWFLGQLAGGSADFDLSLKPTQVVQGRLYLNINYYARNMALVMPFDPESVGAPAGLVKATARPSLTRQLALPLRLRRTYRWAANFYRHTLVEVDRQLREAYQALADTADDPLPCIWPLCEPEFYARCRDTDRAHIVVALTITALDGVVRRRAPQLLNLFVGQETATSLLSRRIWALRNVAERCGPQVIQMLRQGVADLGAYETVPHAAPLVTGIREFIREYGHRGLRFEADFETERLADRPEHILLAIAAQLGEQEPPEVRAGATWQAAQEALTAMSVAQRPVWRQLLRWGRQLISWREDSKSNIALRQAVYGRAARHLARHFYPDQPDDLIMFYTLDEFLAFVRSQGRQRVDMETLDWRRARFELYQTQPPPPELIWYDPDTGHWRPAAPGEAMEPSSEPAGRLTGIAASSGPGPVEGLALVTNDPLEAGRRLLEMDGPVILVTRLTDPAWSGLFPRLSAVVTELGGVISHAAIVARENGLPAVVGIPAATQKVRNGQRLRVDGQNGVVEVLA